MKTKYFVTILAIALFFVSCETVEDPTVPAQKPVKPAKESSRLLEESQAEITAKQTELQQLEEELNAEMANLRAREQELDRQFTRIDSLLREVEQREKIAEAEIAHASQLRLTGRWLTFVGIIMIVLALYILFRPKKQKVDVAPEPKDSVVQEQDLQQTIETEITPLSEEGESAIMAEETDESSDETKELADEELYKRAKKLVIEHQKAAISFLQNELQIGRAKVMTLLDQMEADGIVGPAAPGKSREVLQSK